mmetsp:Transcript_26829/g.43820  ORF Transcript_26829/g.43820 Transcript_26829/m.43820 type:complete len:170 (+) Transcript_26829:721-1230(+)
MEECREECRASREEDSTILNIQVLGGQWHREIREEGWCVTSVERLDTRHFRVLVIRMVECQMPCLVLLVARLMPAFAVAIQDISLVTAPRMAQFLQGILASSVANQDTKLLTALDPIFAPASSASKMATYQRNVQIEELPIKSWSMSSQLFIATSSRIPLHYMQTAHTK